MRTNDQSATELDDDEMMMGMKISAIKRGILKELTGLVEKGVFEVVEPNSVATSARVISSRFVHKPMGTDVKSRLVVRTSTIRNHLEESCLLQHRHSCLCDFS